MNKEPCRARGHFKEDAMRSWMIGLLATALPALAQTEMSISEMQAVSTASPDSSIHCNEVVTVEGIALSSSEHFYSGSHSSFYLIDENGGDYSGVLVYHPDADVFDVYVGDRLRVTGTVSEYRTTSSGIVSNMTELVPGDPSVDVEVLDYEQPLPEPVFVDMWYLDPIRHNEHVGERYEGMLMEIHDAVVVDISAPPSFRQFTVADPQGNHTIVRTAAYSLGSYGRPPLGSTFEVIKGVIYQVYGNYNVMPRDISDLVLAVGPPIISGTTVGPCGATSGDMISIATNLSDNTAIDEAFVYYRVNGGAFTEYPLVRDLSNPVLFTSDLPAQPAGSLVEFYIYAMDDEGNPSYHPAEGAQAAEFPQIYISDAMPATCAAIQLDTYPDGGSHLQCHEATLTGTITFGYSDFGFLPEDTYRNYLLADATGAGNAMYLYNNTGHAAFMDSLEQGDRISVTGTVTEYNGLTELTNISAYTLLGSGNDVTAAPTTIPALLADPEPWESVLVELQDITVVDSLGYGEWLIRDDQDNQLVLDNLGVWTVALEAGAHMDALVGAITWNFGAWKIAPRQNEDFVNLTGVTAPLKPLRFSLDSAAPNPFNPSTRIAYTLESPAQVALSVFNLAGQQVATLAQGAMPAGSHSVVFDGSALASGLYVARLDADGRSAQMKLLLVK